MDNQMHRRSLFKEHKEVLTPNQHSRNNRKLQEANRNKKRKDLFQCARNISPSPTPHRASKDKENHHNEVAEEANRTIECEKQTTANKTLTAKLVCTARDPAKIKKQEAYLLRFLDWKDKKKATMEKQKCDRSKRRPFVSAVSKDSGFGGKIAAVAPKAVAAPAIASNYQPSSSFVPKGHNEFKPPPGLKYPEEMVKEKIKSRQSIYTTVPTPPKKNKTANDCVIAKASLPPNMHYHLNSNPKKTPARTNCATAANNKHTKVATSGAPKMVSAAVATGSGNKSTIISVPKTPSTTKPQSNLVKTFNKVSSLDKKNPPTTGSGTTTTTATATSVLPANKQKSMKMLPPPTVPTKRPPPSSKIRKAATAAQKITTNGAKFKIAAPSAAKRLESNKPSKPGKNGKNASPQQPQKNARLTKTMKAKKPTKQANGPKTTKLVSLMLNQVGDHVADMIVQTPRDFSNSNHFEDFVTSTKVKNSNQTLEEVRGVSPIEPLAKRTSNSAKRNLLKEATMKSTQHKLGSLTAKEKKDKENMDNMPQITTAGRFNFVRYSEINVTINDEDEEEENNVQNVNDKCHEQQKAQEVKQTCSPENEENITLVAAETTMQEDKTPTKQKSDEDKPVNYLSPYVSVSRGKVSLKKEKEKRNSIYLASPMSGVEQLNVSVHNDTTMVSSPKSPQYTTEIRRTLEAVRYYRKQLQDEIDRLDKQCNVWETYKDENIALLQAANVDDMIDVAVGQTRLLTSKKFMQFKGLIDRCEAGATGIGHRPDDGSEATKSISSIDLEGFWSMMGLQVENVEKRFENLNRWKSNNWQDPDQEVKPKAPKPKNLTKVKKKVAAPVTKAKPNSALQQMLRKMQAEMRNKKVNNMLATAADDIILTPSKVRDRKYFSPAATVVGIPTTANRRNSLLMRKNSQDSPNRRMSIGGGGRPNSQESPNRRISIGGGRPNSQESPNPRRVSIGGGNRCNSQESPRRLPPSATIINEKTPTPLTRRSTLHEAIMRANAEAFNSPKVQGRKSILKTPGSARTNLRNVVFNQKCRVKKFNFIINDGEDDNRADAESNESIEEDMKQSVQESDQEAESGSGPGCGTYSLRNRKVRLRPSCEIVIPK